LTGSERQTAHSERSKRVSDYQSRGQRIIGSIREIKERTGHIDEEVSLRAMLGPDGAKKIEKSRLLSNTMSRNCDDASSVSVLG